LAIPAGFKHPWIGALKLENPVRSPHSSIETELIRVVRRGRIEEVNVSAVAEFLSAFTKIHVDVGTGDAVFPYREAQRDPKILCIGIDPVAENMTKISNRIGRKPARGGVNNLLLIVANVETIPRVLDGKASRLTILFPWGSLLRSLVVPVPAVLMRLRALLSDDGEFESLLNMQVFDDKSYRDRHKLPPLDVKYIEDQLSQVWTDCGLNIFIIEQYEPNKLPIRTSWGQHLTLGSNRKSIFIKARANKKIKIK
jgi:16S rRNA (adenine(1408)-N(1))-methyltransferase